MATLGWFEANLSALLAPGGYLGLTDAEDVSERSDDPVVLCGGIDPAYCDVIVQRWEAFTGRKAERATSNAAAEEKAPATAEA